MSESEFGNAGVSVFEMGTSVSIAWVGWVIGSVTCGAGGAGGAVAGVPVIGSCSVTVSRIGSAEPKVGTSK